jgi:hypothetical protein
MQPEKWTMIKGNIKDNFKVEDEGSEHLDEDGGIDIEYIEFFGPLGRIRLEYISQPVVLDKKTTYSRRIGSETNVDYVYSESERSYRVEAYKWDEKSETWSEIDGSSFA